MVIIYFSLYVMSQRYLLVVNWKKTLVFFILYNIKCIKSFGNYDFSLNEKLNIKNSSHLYLTYSGMYLMPYKFIDTIVNLSFCSPIHLFFQQTEDVFW